MRGPENQVSSICLEDIELAGCFFTPSSSRDKDITARKLKRFIRLLNRIGVSYSTDSHVDPRMKWHPTVICVSGEGVRRLQQAHVPTPQICLGSKHFS